MSNLKIVTILGARPQFIKAAAVSNILRTHFTEILIHTGQHYDSNMSSIFFDELGIPKPEYNLNIGSAERDEQVRLMQTELEAKLKIEKPDFVLVYGDTNSTLAGALAASKLNISLIHVEAGLRSFNSEMPEEKNRIETDKLSKILFVPTQTAIHNLRNEGITNGVVNVGDVMYDSILHFAPIAKEKSKILETLELIPDSFCLCTIHRAENTNNISRLKSICKALNNCAKAIVLPLHPRTLKYLNEHDIKLSTNIKVIEPVGYLDMLTLEMNASKIVTDSGGVQKEAFFLKKPCITLRNETEWVETVESGWNKIVEDNTQEIIEAINNFNPTGEVKNLFGDGNAAILMVEYIKNYKK